MPSDPPVFRKPPLSPEGEAKLHVADATGHSPWSPNLVDRLMHMRAASQQASRLLKALSHPDRLLLLCQLSQGEHCVGELEALLGLGQPSLSQQLGVLRQEGLVHTRREGKQVFYAIASADALAVLELLYARFCPPDGPNNAGACLEDGGEHR